MTNPPTKSDAVVRPRKASVLLVLGVLLLGSALAWWGIRGGPSPERRSFAGAATQGVVSVSDQLAAIQRGSVIVEKRCAGCHSPSGRLTGPGFSQIAAHYRPEAEAMAELSGAVVHPAPGWANYPPGPPFPDLTIEDRSDLALYILHSDDQGH